MRKQIGWPPLRRSGQNRLERGGCRDWTIDEDRRGGEMVRIIVVCGAGASSTFVAHRIRRAAAARGIDVRATATSDSAVEGALGDADVLLVGAHLGERIGALRERAAAASVPIVILEEGAATAPDGEEALDLALEFAGVGS
ncbi:MAG TPA: PTS sugar transporter [Agromyces sp.]